MLRRYCVCAPGTAPAAAEGRYGGRSCGRRRRRRRATREAGRPRACRAGPAAGCGGSEPRGAELADVTVTYAFCRCGGGGVRPIRRALGRGAGGAPPGRNGGNVSRAQGWRCGGVRAWPSAGRLVLWLSTLTRSVVVGVECVCAAAAKALRRGRLGWIRCGNAGRRVGRAGMATAAAREARRKWRFTTRNWQIRSWASS